MNGSNKFSGLFIRLPRLVNTTRLKVLTLIRMGDIFSITMFHFVHVVIKGDSHMFCLSDRDSCVSMHAFTNGHSLYSRIFIYIPTIEYRNGI